MHYRSFVKESTARVPVNSSQIGPTRSNFDVSYVVIHCTNTIVQTVKLRVFITQFTHQQYSRQILSYSRSRCNNILPHHMTSRPFLKMPEQVWLWKIIRQGKPSPAILDTGLGVELCSIHNVIGSPGGYLICIGGLQFVLIILALMESQWGHKGWRRHDRQLRRERCFHILQINTRIIVTSWHGKALCVSGPLWGETGDSWILTKDQWCRCMATSLLFGWRKTNTGVGCRLFETPRQPCDVQ